MNIYTQEHTNTRTDTHTNRYKHEHIQTHGHTHTHTHTHTHIIYVFICTCFCGTAYRKIVAKVHIKYKCSNYYITKPVVSACISILDMLALISNCRVALLSAPVTLESYMNLLSNKLIIVI